MKRSDLICENGVINDNLKADFVHEYKVCGTKCSEITIGREHERILGKAPGRYFTLFSEETDCTEAVFRVLSELIPREGSALVVGLGNERISADSLGAKCLRFVPATAHLAVHEDFTALGMRKVYALETGVTGQTGIESARQVRLVAEGVDAAFVIAIDSLACSESERLCKTVQITDAGIEPGAGVGNSREAMNEKTIGRKVFAVGVPTVIDYDAGGATLMVTPRNIDRITDRCARLLGSAVSRALNPSLSEEELSALIL